MRKLLLILTMVTSTAFAATIIQPTSIESSMLVNKQDIEKITSMPAEFNSKYFSELYLINNQKYAKDVGSYCTNNISSSQIELVNCNTALKVTNVWYKFYTYSGVILNNMLGFTNTVGLFIFIFIIFVSLKDIRKILINLKDFFQKLIKSLKNSD